jgi:hypothetical protein
VVFVGRAGCLQVEGASKKRRGIGGGGGGVGGSQASSSRRDRGLAIDFKEPQVRGASATHLLCWLIHKLHSVWRSSKCSCSFNQNKDAN